MSAFYLIDVHAHLQDEKFSQDCEAVIQSALSNGVNRILNAATSLSDSKSVVEIARRHSCCKALVGIHPHDADGFGDNSIEELKALTKDKNVLGIGEIGLDYHYDFSPRETQRKVFRELWLLAAELGLPAVIHVREAYDDFFSVISKIKAPPKVMLHCFSGDMDIARKAVDMGFNFSIGGVLTYPKSDMTREVFRHIPDSMIHIETDCPYLAPQTKRGKRNEPAYIVSTLEYMARIKKKSNEEMAEILKTNAVNFFGSRLIE